MKNYINSEFLDSEEKLLLIDYEKLYHSYVSKNCKKCVQQEQRECSLLRGFSRPACMQMEKWIQKKQKNEKKKIFCSWVTDLEQQVSETNSQHYAAGLFDYY